MEYGLIALFAVVLTLAFLVFQAYRSISDEGRKLSSLLSNSTSQNLAIEARITAVTSAADESRKAVALLRETHYDAVMARLKQLEAVIERVDRTSENNEERIKSLNARASAIARHRKKLEEEDDSTESTQAVEYEQAAAPPQMLPRHFGKRLG